MSHHIIPTRNDVNGNVLVTQFAVSSLLCDVVKPRYIGRHARIYMRLVDGCVILAAETNAVDEWTES